MLCTEPVDDHRHLFIFHPVRPVGVEYIRIAHGADVGYRNAFLTHARFQKRHVIGCSQIQMVFLIFFLVMSVVYILVILMKKQL